MEYDKKLLSEVIKLLATPVSNSAFGLKGEAGYELLLDRVDGTIIGRFSHGKAISQVDSIYNNTTSTLKVGCALLMDEETQPVYEGEAA